MYSDDELNKIFGESSEPSLTIGGKNVSDFKSALDDSRKTGETPSSEDVAKNAGMSGIKSGVSTGLATGNPYAGAAMGAATMAEGLYSGNKEKQLAEEEEMQRKEMARLKAKSLALDEYKNAFS